jgi:predicted metalloprotease with PDZ domain
MSDLNAGSIAVTTFGEGDFALQTSPDALMQGYYMAGPAGRYPESGTVDGFSATWLGRPPFDAQLEMAWTGRAYAYLRTFFRDTTREPFRVFLRVVPGAPRYAGTALRNSFMLGTPVRDTDSLATAPRETLVHELVHHWALGIQGAQGANTWFAEGLATHYARLLTMRAGLDSIASYGRSLNETARNYYTSPARNLTADSIGRLGFSDEAARRVPYLRGALYFADLDARVRAASGRRRTLDDLLIPLFQRIRSGESVDQREWIEIVVRELGGPAREQFEAVILRGETIVPASHAFGPCFERRPAVFRTGEGAAGAEVNGFEWIRIASLPDARCRAW